MQELAQELALERRQHIWVDGSLRDGEWFSQVFDSIRRRYPEYSIAIFYVYASEKTVRQRVAKRAKSTGRTIPESMLKASLEGPDRALRFLTPRVDFVARINNDGEIPLLEAFEYVDRSGSWLAVQRLFAHLDGPRTLYPFNLQPFNVVSRELRASSNCAFKLDALLTERTVNDHGKLSISHADWPETLSLCVSPLAAVRFDEYFMRSVNIPSDARFYAFCYALCPDSLAPFRSVLAEDDEEPIISMIRHGGFLFFNAQLTLISLDAVSSRRQPHAFHFGPPIQLRPNEIVSLEPLLRPVASLRLRRCGARLYCWVPPHFVVGGDRCISRFGGFAFLGKGAAQDVFFPVIEV
eukprot:m.5434 g.5434  ORF g.5434 m.5434 type:complete len:352 (+) comp2513_c0_seq1:1294-2349(+)